MVFSMTPEMPGVPNQSIARMIPLRTEALRSAGERLRETEPKNALKLFQEALALDPTSAQLNKEIGICMIHLGRWEEARASLERSLANKGDYYYALVNMVTPLIFLWDLPRAQQYCDKALALHPVSEKGLTMDAMIKNLAGDFAGSLRSAERARAALTPIGARSPQPCHIDVIEVVNLSQSDEARAMAAGDGFSRNTLGFSIIWRFLKPVLAMSWRARRAAEAASQAAAAPKSEEELESEREIEEMRRRLAAELIGSDDDDADKQSKKKGKRKKKESQGAAIVAVKAKPGPAVRSPLQCDCPDGGVRRYCFNTCSHTACEACLKRSKSCPACGHSTGIFFFRMF